MKFFNKILKSNNTQLKANLREISKQRDKLLVDVYNFKNDIKSIQENNSKTLSEQRAFFNSELDRVRYIEGEKWKVIVDKRDENIKALQKTVDDNDSFFNFLKERDTAFKEMVAAVNTRWKAGSTLYSEGDQFFLAAGSKYEEYERKYLKYDKEK
jgi:hypothetical protein